MKDELFDRDEMEELIRKYIHSARDREILCDRLLDHMLFKELCAKHHLSMRQLQRIVSKGDKLFIIWQDIHKNKDT